MSSDGAPPVPRTLGTAKIAGCIVVALLGGALAVVGLIAVMVFGIFAGIKHSDAYCASTTFLKAQPVVVASLGRPIEDGTFPNGSVQTSGGTGTASFTISLSGPRGEGNAYVESVLDRGAWRIVSASWTFAGSSVDLLPAAPPLGTGASGEPRASQEL